MGLETRSVGWGVPGWERGDERVTSNQLACQPVLGRHNEAQGRETRSHADARRPTDWCMVYLPMAY